MGSRSGRSTGRPEGSKPENQSLHAAGAPEIARRSGGSFSHVAPHKSNALSQSARKADAHANLLASGCDRHGLLARRLNRVAVSLRAVSAKSALLEPLPSVRIDALMRFERCVFHGISVRADHAKLV